MPRVALFITCVNDALFPAAPKAVVQILERLGYDVDFPEAQTCCGQMHANSGYKQDAATLASAFETVFGDYDAIVTPSGSCAAMARDQYPHLIGSDIGDHVYELSEFLIDVAGVEDVGARFPHTVTYHPTCHGTRALGLGDKPMRLLRAVEDIELVDLPAADQCCGFGGTFALKNSEVSSAMLADKCRNAAATGAEYLAAADNSCLTHIGGGISRLQHTAGAAERRGPRPIHYAEILASTA
ncbi:(Fe-S)-binding protein [Glycomyces algeriensis]|uniref:Fe-S oxidoreductase n=1 Tax=Glycomyces algeriensis TaxID=256037 RepID=A0A9W6G674_9ACTN|nr:(Fe-S)-binding protein [Glycomyces algeriensis]MDA1368965.1 (Fe-S)-binding protein [Glycomyces algeriensis]MDR7353292.1 L-lactate dehydrogenase complex protein LldE [Glycomyces algeriensis]GLI40988.1 Fe-S oxidoreductase [Glycomyces algeriensis]